ncbi:hypothetical protein ACHAWO_005816 [Cyclotella atomus]|uniref:Isochorismatase-like domain-containing protein n=1 Tax=Cyclotella atomus TaxID=382360 RepID=A0ABD3NPI0_9STRA
MTTLLLIDIQNDFHPGGSLAIPSANTDAERTASFIKRNALSIDRIVATLDSHHKLHIAHPCFWKDVNGEHPPPFTLISSQDVIDGKWIPRNDLKCPPIEMPSVQHEVVGDTVTLYKENGDVDTLAWSIEYTKRLEEKGRFQLCIWPEHCLIGTPGHNVVKIVRDAMDEWSHKTGRSVEFVEKGQNLFTEMYSALCAEVPVNSKSSFNSALLDSLKQSKQLIVCGQAMSHCVNYTVRDIVENWPKDEMNKITLLSDCASSVPGFEAASEKFVEDMTEVGVVVTTSENV